MPTTAATTSPDSPQQVILRLGADTPTTFLNSTEPKVIDILTKDEFFTTLKDQLLSMIVIHVSSSNLPILYNPLALASLVSSLRSDGEGTVSVVIFPSDDCVDVSVVKTSFVLAGLQPEDEYRESGGVRVLTARLKPAKTNHTGRSIQLLRKENVTKEEIHLKHKIMLDDDLEDDANLIDEDDLLDMATFGNGMLAPPPKVEVQARASNQDDCGGRKACDNCSCGRAEMERTAGSAKLVNLAPITSSCGNCSKGDAFRCAGCPFLGKPAFKAGEEHVILDLMDDL